MPGNPVLRRQLEALVETTRPTYRAAWRALCAAEDHAVIEVAPADSAYNCHAFALAIQALPQYARYQALWNEAEAIVSGAFMQRSLDRGVLRRKGGAAFDAGDLVIYFQGDRVRHSARVSRPGVALLSKWGTGGIYEHPLFEIPLSYGDRAEVVRGADPATTMAELESWVAAHGY